MKSSRIFFIGIGVYCILLAVVGFGPNLYANFQGKISFPPIVHLHGALMLAWLTLYTVQATLVARGNLALHRRMGWATVVLAAVIWLFMGATQISALQRYDPEKFAFILQPMLIGFGQEVVFPVLVIWAVLARQQADWHKRLMTLATFVLMQAALDRMFWLPNEGLPMFWHAGLRLYVLLLLPLFVFDLVRLKRLHPATLIGSALIVAMHGVISFYWNHPGYQRAMGGFWMWLRQ